MAPERVGTISQTQVTDADHFIDCSVGYLSRVVEVKIVSSRDDLDPLSPGARAKVDDLDPLSPGARGKVDDLDALHPVARGEVDDLDPLPPGAQGEADDLDPLHPVAREVDDRGPLPPGTQGEIDDIDPLPPRTRRGVPQDSHHVPLLLQRPGCYDKDRDVIGMVSDRGCRVHGDHQ
jgi:hypothetical protein